MRPPSHEHAHVHSVLDAIPQMTPARRRAAHPRTIAASLYRLVDHVMTFATRA